jgi:hypothetical protein
MRWTRRRVRTTTTWVVVVGWGVFYVVALAHADPLPTLDTAVMWLVVPPLLWVLAVRLVLRHRWSETGSHMSAMDVPGGVLAAAVAALPERRRDWGRAMTAELAGIQGRSARWRFALSSARAALRLPPLGGWPGLALGTGVVVAAAIAVTVIFLRREPAAAEYLPPAAAVYLAAVLAGCLWIAVASPRWLGTSRLAPHLGAAAAVVFAAWFLLSNRTDGTQPPPLLVLGLAARSWSHQSPSSSSRRSWRGGPAGHSARACRPPSGPWPPSCRSPTPCGCPRGCVVTRSTAGCSTARWSLPSAPTCPRPWSSASESFPWSASPSL